MLKIAVVGAGIGGLSAAVGLGQAGFEVDVYEQAPRLTELNPRCEEVYGAPHLTLHRADLLSIIASGFPTERVHLGHRLVGFTDKGTTPGTARTGPIASPWPRPSPRSRAGTRK